MSQTTHNQNLKSRPCRLVHGQLSLCTLSISAIGLFTCGDVSGTASINYGSTLNAENFSSGGAALDETFTFELGVFDGLFTPDGTNLGQWYENWIALPNGGGGTASAQYDPSQITDVPPIYVNNFEGTAVIVDNMSDPDDPLTPHPDPGAPGAPRMSYIWGYDKREGTGKAEWILLANAAWTVPEVAADDLPTSINWAVSDPGTIVVAALGSVNPGYLPLQGSQPPHILTGDVDLDLLNIPEPSSAALAALAACGLLIRRRR